MPGYQLAVVCGLWLALTGGRTWRSLGIGLAWLFGSQIGFILGAAAVHAQWGFTPHAIVVRAWSIGIPAVIALFWTSSGGHGARLLGRQGELTANASDKLRPAAASGAVRSKGIEHVVDASGCDPDALRSPAVLQALFRDIVQSLGLTPIGAPIWHTFPGAGGVTGIIMLSESHLSVHTYPETGFAAFDLYCCRPLVDWPWKQKLVAALGAREVTVKVIDRG